MTAFTRRSVSVAAALLAISGSAIGAAERGILRGSVKDSNGAAIPMAHLIVHEDISGRSGANRKSDITVALDNAGRFTQQLERGFYDVCVMADAFVPECRKVLVTQGRTIEHPVCLKIDAAVVKRIGDRF